MPRLPPGTAPPGIAHSILGFCGAGAWGAHEMHHHGRDDGVRVVRGCKDGERRYDWGKWI